jgi:hypothetical protein
MEEEMEELKKERDLAKSQLDELRKKTGSENQQVKNHFYCLYVISIRYSIKYFINIIQTSLDHTSQACMFMQFMTLHCFSFIFFPEIFWTSLGVESIQLITSSSGKVLNLLFLGAISATHESIKAILDCTSNASARDPQA